MMSTPKPVRARPSLGEPTRLARAPRDRSPGAVSCGSGDDAGSDLGAHGPAERAYAGVSRTSLHPNAQSRQSRDPRPVGDKAYAKDCAINVTDFLNTRGYGKQIFADKFLKEPTNKDFFDVFRFLMAKLDPQLEFEGPPDLEVQQIMRRLKYPTEVNASKLRAVNGPNTWPQLLAVLDWLIELINMNESYIQPLATCETGADDTERAWLRKSLQESYPKFLSGIDDQEEEERLKQVINERKIAVEEEIRRLEAHAEEKDMELAKYQQEHNMFVELQDQPKALEKQADLERANIMSHEGTIQRLEQYDQVTDDKIVAAQSDIEQLDAAVRQLTEQVEGQAFSKKDIERLKQKREQSREARDKLAKEGEKAEQDVWELMMKENERHEEIDRLVRQAHNTVEQTLGYGQDSLLVRVNLEDSTDVLATLDFADERQQVGKLQKEREDALLAEEAALNNVIKEGNEERTKVEAKERQKHDLDSELDQKRRVLDDNRAKYHAELDDVKRIVTEAEEQVHLLSLDPSGVSRGDVAEARQQYDALKLHQTREKQRQEQEIQQLQEQLRREKENAAEHRQRVRQELEGYANDIESLCKGVVEEVDSIASDGMTAGIGSRAVRKGGC